MPIHRSHPLFRDDKALCFVDPWPWLDHMRTVDFTFGTRIHGNIAALLAGTPSYVLAPRLADAGAGALLRDPASGRDRPAAGHRRGPAVRGGGLRSAPWPATPERFRTFIDYVERQGLRHVFQPGEDPTAFDRKIASIDFPPPARTRTHLAVPGPGAASAASIRKLSRAARRAA